MTAKKIVFLALGIILILLVTANMYIMYCLNVSYKLIFNEPISVYSQLLLLESTSLKKINDFSDSDKILQRVLINSDIKADFILASLPFCKDNETKMKAQNALYVWHKLKEEIERHIPDDMKNNNLENTYKFGPGPEQ